MPFQSLVYTRPAPAVVGDFHSNNPYAIYSAGPGGLVAGPSGLTVGRFAWLSNSTQDWDGGAAIANNFGSGPVAGFVHRQQQGLITQYLLDNGLVVPPGFAASLVTLGDLWIKNEGTTEAVQGQYAYANYSSGAASFGAAGSPPAGGTSTTSTVAAGTATVVGSLTGNLLVVTSVTSGTLYPGSLISAGALAGTQIVSQISGTVGGIGIYAVNIGEQSVASGTSFTTTYGLLTVSGAITGTWSLGQLVTGGTVAAGSYIWANSGNGAALTGAGGAGTYVINTNTAASSAALAAASAVQTKWFALSSALPGELVKATAQVLG